MSEPLRLGVVGCGGSRQTYGATVRLVDAIEVTALMDPDAVAARSWLRNPRGVATYCEFEPFVAEAPADAVLVTSPLEARAAQAAAIAASGRHVLCERPAARSLPEFDAIEQSACDAGAVAMVGLAKRYDSAFQAAATLLEDRAIGEPIHARCDWAFLTEWEEHRRSLRTWPGVFRELASQTVDLARWWLGGVQTVSADVDMPGSATRKREVANLILNHERGVSVHHYSRTTQRNSVEQYLIRGTQGSLHIGMTSGWSYLSAEPFRLVLHRRGHEPEDLTRTRLRRAEDEARAHNPYVRILNAFAAQVAAGQSDTESLTSARQALEVVHAAYVATTERTKVSLPLVRAPELGEGW